MCVCVRACVRARARACVYVCVRARARARVLVVSLRRIIIHTGDLAL